MPIIMQRKATTKATTNQNKPKLCANVKIDHGFKSHAQVT